MITIFKAIARIIGLCVKIVYSVLRFFRVRLLAIYLIACVAVQLIWHLFDGREAIFWGGFTACCVVTVFCWIMFFRNRYKQKHLKRTPKVIEDEEDEREEPPQKREEGMKLKKIRQQKPVYYDVAGRPDYVFAEFEDRYELYRKENGGLTYIKTDYKNV